MMAVEIAECIVVPLPQLPGNEQFGIVYGVHRALHIIDEKIRYAGSDVAKFFGNALSK